MKTAAKKTQENNIIKLVEAGIISINLPKMGGIIVINDVCVLNNKKYYEGRGARFNKNFIHEKVYCKITQKELAKAMRHYKMNLKVKEMRRIANAKNERKGYNPHFCYTNKNTMTIASKLYFPEVKEISRIKI